MNYRPSTNTLPPVVKNLLIINVLMWLATIVLKMQGVNLTHILGLHNFQSVGFRPYQLVTHMFMHDDSSPLHLIFNMFALWMFGRVLESVWGPKRFFIYYFITGLGAALLHNIVNFIEFRHFAAAMQPETVQAIVNDGFDLIKQNMNYTDPQAAKLNFILNGPTVGASGAVFGLLLGFGMLFPNTQLMLLFPPIPIRAKYFVIGYGAIELFSGIANTGDNIAHFAHLGGMLFGFIMIKYWNRNTTHFY